jgi:hypothetical protein
MHYVACMVHHVWWQVTCCMLCSVLLPFAVHVLAAGSCNAQPWRMPLWNAAAGGAVEVLLGQPSGPPHVDDLTEAKYCIVYCSIAVSQHDIAQCMCCISCTLLLCHVYCYIVQCGMWDV